MEITLTPAEVVFNWFCRIFTVVICTMLFFREFLEAPLTLIIDRCLDFFSRRS